MKKKIFIVAGALIIAVVLLAGCQETVVIGTGEIRGTLHKLNVDNDFGNFERYQYIEITLKDGENISVLTVYRYHGQNTNNFDWHRHLKALKGEEISISYAQASDDETANIISVTKVATEEVVVEEIEYTLNLTIIGKGEIRISLSSRSYSTVVSESCELKIPISSPLIQAFPYDGWTFDRWSGDIPESWAKADSMIPLIDSDKELTAHFKEI